MARSLPTGGFHVDNGDWCRGVKGLFKDVGSGIAEPLGMVPNVRRIGFR